MQQTSPPKGQIVHCYQRTSDGCLLFYTIRDYLVFFTLFCTIAREFEIKILKLCLMPDHIHFVADVKQQSNLSEFVKNYSSLYARIFNIAFHRHGQLFSKSYGRAVKTGAKRIRSCLTYVDNNPVERHLCDLAEEYRWDFIAYGRSAHPYSKRLIIRKSSWEMRKSISMARRIKGCGNYLTYRLIDKLFSRLDKVERQQLIDYIIKLYSCLDHKGAIGYFRSYESMIAAAKNNTGSEYDIIEKAVGRSDAVYSAITKIIVNDFGIRDIHDLFLLSKENRWEIYNYLLLHSTASKHQLVKYLHLSNRP